VLFINVYVVTVNETDYITYYIFLYSLLFIYYMLSLFITMDWEEPQLGSNSTMYIDP